MEEIVALVRTHQIKKRLAGVTALLDALKTDRDPLTSDSEFLTALLADVAPCLRENNFKVAMTSLEIIELLLARVADTAVRAQFKAIWNGLVECLGDSKLQVREKAVDVVVRLAQILGVAVLFDRLRPCIAHKNWRTREQTVHALWRCLEELRLFSSYVKNEVLDDTVRLLEDSAKEVRDAAMRALEKFYEHLGPSLMFELENKKIRAGHMKTLTDKFSGGSGSTMHTHAQPAYVSATSYGVADPPRAVDTAPLSSTARFLTAIKNKQYDFNNIDSAVEAFSRPTLQSAAPPSLDKSPSQSSTASQSASVADAAAAATVASSRPAPGFSDKDILRELAKIADGLRLDNDWSVRVESLKSFQRLALKCNQSGAAAVATLAQGVRPLREVLSEQVVDLRSSVAREACQALQSLAKVLKDDFNPHAEYFMNNLMKATYVTILVISTASDTSIRGIIESTKNGYNRMIAKFIEGAKTRNQVLRINCVSYLTLTLERWNVAFLNKHIDLFVQILPALLHDAVAEVRAQARKCFWALHRLFPQEADNLLERMDASTQRNVREDAAAREKRTGDDQTAPPLSGTTSTFSSSGRFSLRKENSFSRLVGDAAPTGLGSSTSSSTIFLPANEMIASSAMSGGAAKVPVGLSSSSTVGGSALGPRRVLGGGPFQGVDGAEPSRSLPSRVLGSGGPMRVGLPGRIQQHYEDDTGAQAIGRPPSGPLRVLKQVDRVEPLGNQNIPPVPRAQRVQIAADVSSPSAKTGESSGPVARKDRQNGPKRRALTPEVETPPADEQTGERSIDTEAQAPRASFSSRDQSGASSKPTRSAPVFALAPTDEGFEDALARIENGLWSVRLEAIELIDRTLEKSSTPSGEAPASAGSAKERKMDERVLLALIRHLTDGHYRVAQAALKALQSCLLAVNQQQVAPFLKTILPRLFQKLVDPKESTRVVARDILEFFVSKYDATVLIGYVIQQLTDGSNMKMKAAVCRYVKELLPGARDYIQQSANNAHMRGLLSKIAQLLESDAPVAVATGCGAIVQVACSLYPNEVESAMPLLAPSKRSTVSRVLREKGIVLSLTQSGPATASTLDNQPPPPPSAEVTGDKAPPSRKRHAQSPSKFASSPLLTSRKEPNAALLSDSDSKLLEPRAPVLDYDKLGSLSDFASMMSQTSEQRPDEQLEELLAIVGDNNIVESQKAAAYHKMGSLFKSETDSFWEKYFPRVLSVLLEAASERDANAVRILQRFVRAQPHRAEEFFHPILIGLLDSINGTVDLSAHLAELTLTDIVRGSTQLDRVLDLLMPLIERREPPALQVVLLLVRAVLEQAAEHGASKSSALLLRSPEWNGRLLSLLVAKLQHASSDVRKRAVDCLVAYHFATNEDAQLAAYLAQHADVTKQKLVDIFIQRKKKADRERATVMDVSA